MSALVIVIFLLGAVVFLQFYASARAERRAPPIGAFVEVEGARLHVIDLPAADGSDGPPVLLIHGASVNARDMKIALGDRLCVHRSRAGDSGGRSPGRLRTPATPFTMPKRLALSH